MLDPTQPQAAVRWERGRKDCPWKSGGVERWRGGAGGGGGGGEGRSTV